VDSNLIKLGKTVLVLCFETEFKDIWKTHDISKRNSELKKIFNQKKWMA
jgi:hypothetical protein